MPTFYSFLCFFFFFLLLDFDISSYNTWSLTFQDLKLFYQKKTLNRVI